MKFSDLQFPPTLMRRGTAAAYCDGECNLESLIKAGWVKPLRQQKSNTTFAKDEIDEAVKRARLEGWPEGATVK